MTGATGFVGGRLVGELLRRGHAVRALVRPGSDLDGLDGLELVRGDLSDRDALRRGVLGCQGVFHLAACARVWARNRGVFAEVNVRGTQNVLAAVRDAGVARLVLTSTIVTLGPTAPGVVGDERMPRRTERFFTEYEETKTVSERKVLEQAAHGLGVVIVNPTRVFGPGKLTEGNSVTRMLDFYERGKLPFLLAGGRNVGNWVLVDDLVRGHILAMEHGRPGERYILGGENASQRELFELFDEITGRHRRKLGLPPSLALAFARFERLKADLLGLQPLITPGWVETFLVDWAFSSAKAERELGYTSTPLREGLALTHRWLREQRKARAR